MKNARKKLEPSMESATHCNVQKVGHGETSGENKSNTLGVRKLTGNCLFASGNINWPDFCRLLGNSIAIKPAGEAQERET